MTIFTEYCSPSIAETSAGTVDKLLQRVCCWIRIQRLRLKLQQERRQLLALPESMLRDMGITRADALAEAERRDIPTSRLAFALVKS